MLLHVIILSVVTVSLNYAAVNVKQASHVKSREDESHSTKYPFLAYVNINNNSCAGAILSDYWVITARDCGNTATQGPGWVYAGGHSVQRRRIAWQHSCPHGHRLLLLYLEQPLTFDDAVSALPIARPGTFSGHGGKCEVITFGEKPSETSLNTAHAIETRLAAGSDCARTACANATAVITSSTAAPSPDSIAVGTTAKAIVLESTSQTHSKVVTASVNNSGDASKKDNKDSHGLEVMSPELVDTDLLCSTGITEEATSLMHLGSPLVCKGVLTAVVTPNPSVGASREKKDDYKPYYTAIGPDYSWITENVPNVQVVPWSEAAKEGKSFGSGLTVEKALSKYKMRLSNSRRRRLSRLVNLLAEAEPSEDSSEATKLELDDELEPHFRLNKIFSVWLPLARRVRGVILLNRMLVRPHSELWGEPLEKAESVLRPLRRVKRSSQQQAPEKPDGDAKAPLQQQQQLEPCPEASGDPWRMSAGGDAVARGPCALKLRAPRAITRLAIRDESSRAARWRDRSRYKAIAA